MEETARQVIDDLTSRGALAGAASLVVLAGIIAGWWVWTTRITKEREGIPVTILITGFYVRRANSEFDQLTREIVEESGK